jgi:hypothetical protein
MHRMSISRIICLSKPHNKIHTPYTSLLRSRLLWSTPAGVRRRTLSWRVDVLCAVPSAISNMWRVDVLCVAPSAISNMIRRKESKQARSRDDNSVVRYNFQSRASHLCLSLHNRSLIRPTPRGILSTFANSVILRPQITAVCTHVQTNIVSRPSDVEAYCHTLTSNLGTSQCGKQGANSQQIIGFPAQLCRELDVNTYASQTCDNQAKDQKVNCPCKSRRHIKWRYGSTNF